MGTIQNNAIGIHSNILIDSDDAWCVANPSGQVAKYSTKHTGHVDEFNGNNYTVTQGLIELAKYSDSVLYCSADKQLYVLPHDMKLTGESITLDETILPNPSSTSGEDQLTTIRLNYANGKVQAGKSKNYASYEASLVKEMPQAQILCDRIQERAKKIKINETIKFAPRYLPLQNIDIPYNDTVNITGKIKSVEHDIIGQTTSIEVETEL